MDPLAMAALGLVAPVERGKVPKAARTRHKLPGSTRKRSSKPTPADRLQRRVMALLVRVGPCRMPAVARLLQVRESDAEAALHALTRRRSVVAREVAHGQLIYGRSAAQLDEFEL